MGALAFPGVLWARIPHGRLTKLVASVAVATVIAGGASLIPGVVGTPVAPSSAVLWVATNGNDSTCVRGDQSFPCLTLDRAFDLAQCGDLVEIEGGSYGGQTITGNKGCSSTWTKGATSGVTCTSCVDFQVASGATVTIASYALNGAYYLILEKGAGTALNVGSGTIDGRSTNFILRDATVSSGLYINTANNDSGYANLAFVGGSWGNIDMNGNNIGIYFQTCVSPNCGSGVTGNNVLIDGINWHDFTTSDPTGGVDPPHTEVLRFDGGWQDVTVRNNTFTNIAANTATMFITNLETGAADPANYTFENNYFGLNSLNTFLQVHANVASCNSFSFLYNTIYNSPGGIECGSYSGMQWVGNLGTRQSYATCQGVYTKNVWQDDQNNSGCGTDTWVSGPDSGVGNLGLSTDGYHLNNGSVAEQAGESTYCPATDIDGDTRPDAGTTNCDAGADERT